MTKREFAKRLKDIIKKAEQAQSALAEIDFDSLTDGAEAMKDEIDETIDSIRSEELQEAWQERVDLLDEAVSKIEEIEALKSEFDEIVSNMKDMITE